jgi:hypothetical protein
MQVSDGLHTYKPDVWVSKGAENRVHGELDTIAAAAHRKVLSNTWVHKDQTACQLNKVIETSVWLDGSKLMKNLHIFFK